MFKRVFFHVDHYNKLPLNLGLLILRVFIGLFMAFGHGLGKIPPKAMFVGFLVKMGLPSFLAWAAAISEFIGGLFIALGLATRLSALSLTITMLVAAFMAHGADPFAKQEKALIYLVCFVAIFFTGAGRYSLDAIIDKD